MIYISSIPPCIEHAKFDPKVLTQGLDATGLTIHKSCEGNPEGKKKSKQTLNQDVWQQMQNLTATIEPISTFEHTEKQKIQIYLGFNSTKYMAP